MKTLVFKIEKCTDCPYRKYLDDPEETWAPHGWHCTCSKLGDAKKLPVKPNRPEDMYVRDAYAQEDHERFLRRDFGFTEQQVQDELQKDAELHDAAVIELIEDVKEYELDKDIPRWCPL